MSTLIVIGSLNYPKGSAPTNRIHLYCKALRETGNKAYVISLSAPFDSEQDFPVYGRYQGVPYFYSIKNYIREQSFIKRNRKRLLGLINAYSFIRKIAKKNSNCALHFYNTTFYQELLYKFLALHCKIPTISDAAEVPLFLRKKKKFFKIHQFFYTKIRVLFYDSLIVISQYLNDYYAKICPDKHIIKIPILVDFERFPKLKTNMVSLEKIITYVGYMGGNKDGVLDLLEAFYIVQKTLPDTQLNLIGPIPQNDYINIHSKIISLGLMEHVILKGQINSKEIPYELIKSSVLVLARPNHVQAQAGFPTKLGEYLAAKRPVVITNTGEISNYLEDEESAYISNPGDIDSIASKIVRALIDENKNLIAKKGYEVALRNFDYRHYGIVINDLIENLNKRK